ncbi:MAG: hypothetical protein [Bacteriophage sp.]|nr:MAG: hypothetical protein [Bacteriophage sp.]
MPFMSLVGQSFQLAAKSLSSQRTINYSIENYGGEDDHTKAKMVLNLTPGAACVADLGKDPADIGRGMYYSSSSYAPEFTSVLYYVTGSSVKRMDQDFANTVTIGNVRDNGDQLSMIDNGLDFVLVDGEQLYKSSLKADFGAEDWGTVELPVVAGSTTGERVKPTHVAFLGQRLIVNSRNSNTWYFSKLGLTEFDTETNLDFYSAEQSSDTILALKVVNGSLWCFGQRSYEIWRTTDNQDDPFAYVGGSSSQVGIKAPSSLATVNDLVFWLGSSDVGCDSVWMGKGQSIERISTAGIEDQILTLENREKAIGWAYSKAGNTFYVLTFPWSQRTFVYELSTGTWCERLSREINSGNWQAYLYINGVFANNKIYCQVIDGPTLCWLDDNKFTEYDGRQIVRQRISPTYYDGLLPMILDQITVDMQVGTTELLTGLGSEPKMLLEISRDGGHTYGSIKERSIGLQGNYRKVVRWLSQGMGREIVLKFTVSDPVAHSIYQMRLDYKLAKRT